MNGSFIALVAMPGVDLPGVVTLLSARLRVSGLLLDELVERRVGRQIAEIVIDDGDEVLRGFQEIAIVELPEEPLVLGLGSGAIEASGVNRYLTAQARNGNQIILLDLPLHASARQAGLGAVSVPGLGPVRSTWRALYEERRTMYHSVCTAVVETEGRDLEEVVTAVEEVLGGRIS